MNIDERLIQLDEILNSYETKLGLPQNCPPEIEIKGKAILERSDFSKLTPEECAENAIALGQFSFYIQKSLNKELAMLHWAEESLKRVIAPLLKQQTAYSYEERKLLSISESEAAQKLDQIRVGVLGRVDRLSYLSSRIESVRHGFSELASAKRRWKE